MAEVCKTCGADMGPIRMGAVGGDLFGYADCPKCGSRQFFQFKNNVPERIDDIKKGE